MAYKFFYIPALWPGDAEGKLNAFLDRHPVQTVDRQFVTLGEHAGWSVCVAYQKALSGGDISKRKPGIDYREVLNPADFDMFSELRRLRKRFAEQQAVPPYTVFSNEQLASMVTGRVRSIADLRGIEGIGEARCERYGLAFLKVLAELQDGEITKDPGQNG